MNLFSINKKDKNKVNNGMTKLDKNIKSAQDVMPYQGVYPNGIIETSPGMFTKAYTFDDVNFKVSSDEEQERIFLDFGKMINSIESRSIIQISGYNKTINEKKFSEDVLIHKNGSSYDEYIDEYNNMLSNNLKIGTNNTEKEIYMIVSLPVDNIEIATTEFARIDTSILTALKKINKGQASTVSIYDRLNSIYKMLHPYNQNDFMEFSEFSLENIKNQGITTKDVIAPTSFEFLPKHFILDGNTYGKVMFLDNLPASLSADVFTDFLSLTGNVLVSCTMKPLDVNVSAKLIKNQSININASVIEAQKKATKSGYGANLISPDLQQAAEEAEGLRDDITNRNQKLFLTTLTVVIYGKSLEELEKYSAEAKTIANKHLCMLKDLSQQQREGLCTALPFARKDIYVDRLLTTESTSVFLPFNAYDSIHLGGVYYGLNQITHNLILHDRTKTKNGNAVILGMPGGGKSFSSKREIVHVLLRNTGKDDVFIIDPEREYVGLAKMLNGKVINISLSSEDKLNPMDIDLTDDENPIATKSDYIMGLLATMVGDFGLSGVHRSVADRCVRLLYNEYLQILKRENDKIKLHNSDPNNANNQLPTVVSVPDAIPTLKDFYETLKAQPEPEARNLALGIETYCVGSLNLFAYQSNVSIPDDCHLVVYDTKDIGTTMKELGVQVCLNDVWTRMFSNFKKHKRTWFYIDEFYLLLQNPSSAKFLQMIWKRARKWGGLPTGMTQNVEDLLRSAEARTILSTSDFVMLLSQAPLDRGHLAELFNISAEELEYITNASPGHGLIYNGSTLIPFEDNFPTDTELYKVMTTKADESNDR